MTLNDLLSDVSNRLEEEEGGPIFWSQQNEILPALVDAMFEAALLTGAIQSVSQTVTLTANTTYFNLQNNSVDGVPAGVIAGLRMRAPYTVKKVTLKGLSDIVPGWENIAPGTKLRGWFPLGVSMFGIYPQLTADSQVLMDFLVSPVAVPRPYSVNIVVPFQEEFTSAFPEYAAAQLRMKELGLEAEEASTVMNGYLQKMKALSLWQARLDSLVFTQSSGAMAKVSRRETI